LVVYELGLLTQLMPRPVLTEFKVQGSKFKVEQGTTGPLTSDL